MPKFLIDKIANFFGGSQDNIYPLYNMSKVGKWILVYADANPG